jgi:hypothetical protein
MTANIVFVSVFNPGLATRRVKGRLFVSRYGFMTFCAGGSYPIENPRKNKRREKRPAPVVGLIAGSRRKSRISAENGPDPGHLALLPESLPALQPTGSRAVVSAIFEQRA